MSLNEPLLTADDRAVCERLAAGDQEPDGRRARALLAVDDGHTYAEAAEMSQLTEGQVSYFVRKFRDQGIAAFSSTTPVRVERPAEQAVGAPQGESTQVDELRRLVDELDELVGDLQSSVEADETPAQSSTYGPLRIVTMVRDNISRMTPELQLDVLRAFEGMTVDDLKDLDTWKGMAYMMSYSARFQAGQVRERVSSTINEHVPEPLQPGRLWSFGKQTADRFTPEIVKQILSTFQDATIDDLKDPDTWRGVWYMIDYSLRFQAEQLQARLKGEGEGESGPA